MLIDLDFIEHQALSQVVEKFREVFPNGFNATRENFLKAGRSGVEPRWLATLLLSPNQLMAYVGIEKEIFAEYQQNSNQNWENLKKARTEAYEKYLEQPTADPSEYTKSMEDAVASFRKVDDELWSDYQGSKSVELAVIFGL